MNHPGSRSRGLYFIPLALPLLFYLILPTKNFYWDGVGIAIDIEKRPAFSALLYPSHLAFAVWGSWLYRLSGLLGLHIRALSAMQTVNSLLAGICVLLLYQAAREIGVAGPLSVLAALLFGFSATWWRFATDANAYVPSIFLLLGAYVLILKQRSAVLAGIAWAGAMLFHELAILFLPVALFHYRKDRRAMAAFLATALVPVAVIYWAAFRTVFPDGNLSQFLPWLTVHSPDSTFSFQPWKDFLFTIRGTLRLFLGGRLADFVPGIGSKLLLVGIAIGFAGVLHFIWHGRRTLKAGTVRGDLILWMTAYVAFLFFWMPQNTFYRMFYLPPLILIAALAVRHSPEILAAGAMFAVTLFLWNFTFVTYPQSRVAFNSPLQFALAQHDKWPPGTPIVFHDFSADMWTISYFSPQTAWISMDMVDVARLDDDIQYARREKQALWIEESAYALISSTADGQRWLAEHDRPGELVRFRDEKHEYRFHCAR